MPIADICTMYILIAAATEREIKPVADFIDTGQNRAPGHEVKIVITGVGAVSTTYELTNSIHKKRPGIIIQAGIAGSFTKKRIGEVVAVKEDIMGDSGVNENGSFKTIFDLGLAGENDAPFTQGILSNPNKKLLSLSCLEQVKAITVNEITTSTERIEWYQQKLSSVVESMEGAAFHFVCLMEKIPFLQLRSVSNEIGERDKTKWNMKDAVHNLNEKLISIIKELETYDETYFRI